MSREYKFPNGCSEYGAQMGRRDNITEPDYPVKFRLHLVKLDSGGYDNGGAYWGRGSVNLYYAFGDGELEVQEYFCRAASRQQAKEHVKSYFKNGRFYR